MRGSHGAVAIAAGIAVVAAACQSQSSSPAHAPNVALAPADAIPLKVSISGGPLMTGAAIGMLHKETAVPAFSISKTPVTVAEYKRCVDTGACSPPSIKGGACASSNGNSGATFGAPGTADRPVTCMTSTEANAFCSWVGGRLPRASEWMLAARGPTVQRYAWGTSTPTCAQRANARAGAEDCCGSSCTSDDAVKVAAHSAGDSPLGVSDVLLAPAELMSADPVGGAPVCTVPAKACTASGLLPGSIDFFAREVEEGKPGSRPLATSFRCAWEGAAL